MCVCVCVYNELCDARLSVTKISKEYLDMKREHDDSRNAEYIENYDVERRNHHKIVKVKELEAPTFSNSIRDYPSFKRDYNKHIASLYGKDPYSLKNV